MSSCAAEYDCDVYVIELNAGFAVVGSPRRLTNQLAYYIDSVGWTRDGDTIIYDVGVTPHLRYLWRVRVDGNRPPERIEMAGLGASGPATTHHDDRLAFSRDTSNFDVYRLVEGQPSSPLLVSSFDDYEAQFSPDNRHLAFTSARSGEAENIWVANADGSGARELAHGPGRAQGSPHWSPDGRHIVFDSWGNDGHWHIWMVDAEGGNLHQLTNDPGDQNVPSWSHDGHWIYFSANRRQRARRVARARHGRGAGAPYERR